MYIGYGPVWPPLRNSDHQDNYLFRIGDSEINLYLPLTYIAIQMPSYHLNRYFLEQGRYGTLTSPQVQNQGSPLSTCIFGIIDLEVFADSAVDWFVFKTKNHPKKREKLSPFWEVLIYQLLQQQKWWWK